MNQLLTMLHYMIPILVRQNIKFKFFLISQTQNVKFNRAKLLNVGYSEVTNLNEFDCFIFHDVDLVLQNDKAIYHCEDIPMHFSGYIDIFKYKLLYGYLFGGVTAFSEEAFKKINGYSNEYWGWGGEDDDISHRMH